MYSSLLFFCVAFSTLSGVRGAPTRAASDANFIQCKSLAIKLNEMARELYSEVESPKMSSVIDDPPVSIRAVDECDPQSLQNNKQTCQSRIILALKNYTRIFHKDGMFKNPACSKWSPKASQIADLTSLLLKELREPSEDEPMAVVNWYVSALCRDSVERLYSFSIISARVFSFLAAPGTRHLETKQC